MSSQTPAAAGYDELASAIDPQVVHRLPDIGKLVSLPHTTYALLTLLMKEDTQAKDLERVLSQDPALTAKVISLSNSAFYALEQPVSSLERAILVIGFKELEFMAMGLGLSETFDLSSVPANFDGEGLWLHSLSVSFIAREIAVVSKAVEPSEAMITGLLHELGLIILVSKFPSQFQQLMELVNAGMSLFDAESALGLRHDVIGYMLAFNWNLPRVFQEGILYHHRPKEAPEFKKMTAAAALADILAHKIGYPVPMEALEVDLDYSLKTLNISVPTLQNLIKDLMEKIPRAHPLWLEMMRSGQAKNRGLRSKAASFLEPDEKVRPGRS
ncbi:MAG: HDOD domain-containing protein [Deltaproteobacteria bacterium]|nr:HDOD domain-containing protein [Deltaproteobacteria bacterium]